MGGELSSYRDLKVWQRAVDMVEGMYCLSRRLPSEEKFGLTSQLRRAAVSVPANIAEGYGRAQRGEYLQHLSIARGSLAEVETLLVLCVRLKLLDREETRTAWELCQETGRMLGALQSSLRSSRPSTKPRPPKP